MLRVLAALLIAGCGRTGKGNESPSTAPTPAPPSHVVGVSPDASRPAAYSPRAPGDIDMRLRPGRDPLAGPNWVSTAYMGGLGAGVRALLQLVTVDQRPFAALKIVSLIMQDRIPEASPADLEALTALEGRTGKLADWIVAHTSLFEAACGEPLNFILPRKGEDEVARGRRHWEGCGFERLGLGPWQSTAVDSRSFRRCCS